MNIKLLFIESYNLLGQFSKIFKNFSVCAILFSAMNINAQSTELPFDGVVDYAEIINSQIDGLNEYTISFWFKYDGALMASVSEAFVLGQKDLFEIYISKWSDSEPLAQTIGTKVYKSDGSSQTAGLKFYPTSWTHFTVTVKHILGDTEFKIFRNGYTEGPNNVVSTINSNANPFRIGSIDGVSLYNKFSGSIDEVRIFNKVLTDQQIQRMVYQEIKDESGKVRGTIIDKDISDQVTAETIDWNDLITYYPMNTMSGTTLIDESNAGQDATLFSIASFQPQTAPMPYETVLDGDWTEESTWLHGDKWDIEDLHMTFAGASLSAENPEPWSIIKLHNNVTTSISHKNLGLFIDLNKTFTVNGDNAVSNSWYVELNGTLDLKDDSQLVQTDVSDLATSSLGNVIRRQEGLSNVYRYNYWGSPVGSLGVTTLSDNNGMVNNLNNSVFRLNMLKDNIGSIQYVDTFDPPLTTPATLSTTWLYSYANGVTYFDWNSLDPTTDLQVGSGWTQKGTGMGSGEYQYVFDGKPNNGTILLSASDTGGAGSEQDVSATFTILGNPYPSAIDAHQFILDNAAATSGTIYLWEHWGGDSHNVQDYEGGYATLNLLGKTKAYQFLGASGQYGLKTPTQYLPVGQGFRVEVVATGDINFNNNQRVFKTEASGDSVFFRTANNTNNSVSENNVDNFQIIKLEFITSQELGRELILGFSNQTTTDGFDYGYDASPSETFVNDLTMTLDSKPMVIQGFSGITPEKVVDLNFKSDGNVTYSIKATEFQNLAIDQEVYLVDNITGIYHDLKSGTDYNFTSNIGEFNNRFDIVFQPESALNNDDFDLDNTLIYFNANQNQLFVKGLQQDVKEVVFYNALGQKVYNSSSVTKDQLENGLQVSNLSTGLYIVSVKTENNQTIDKKIIME